MKRVFVVLVVFVGCNSGIVPSFASKFPDATTPSFNSDDSQSTQSQSIEIDLENSNSIDEKELFQTGTDKENVLNERAFIYINKQFKPLHRSQVDSSRWYGKNKPFIINGRSPQNNKIPINEIRARKNPEIQLFIPNVNGESALKTKYNPPSFKNIDCVVKTKLNDDKYFLQKAAKKENVTSQPAVFRLLQKNPNGKIHQETKAFSSEDIKNHHIGKPPDMTSYPRYRVNYKYGFPLAYLWHSEERSNGITQKEDNMSPDGTQATDSSNLSPLDLKDDALLDRYMKETLNSFESKEVLTNNEEKCQSCKKGKSNGLSNCKCQRLDTDITYNQRSDKNKHKCDKASALESRENERLYPKDNDKTSYVNLLTEKLY